MLEAALAVATLGLMVPWLARVLGFEAGPLAYLVAFTPWLTLAWLLLLVLAAVARVWWLAGVISLPAVVSVGWASTMFIGASPAAEADTVTIATVNATFGEVDAEEVVALVDAYDVDVLAVQELTPESFEALESAGLSARLPNVDAWPEEGFTGTGLWTSLPVTESVRVDGFVSRAVQTTVQVGGEEVAVLAAHPMAPGLFSHEAWEADLDLLRTAASVNERTMIVGDLNTTLDHAGLRALEEDGFADAADDAGAGFLFTFPEGRLPLPVVAIDHVLIRGLDWAASSVETVPLTGADHRALVVTYALG